MTLGSNACRRMTNRHSIRAAIWLRYFILRVHGRCSAISSSSVHI